MKEQTPSGTADRPGPWRQTVLHWHLPAPLRRLMPQAVIHWMRQLKGRAVTRDLPRDREVSQSPEDALASASVSVVVPIRDAPSVTRRCLTSLEKYAPQSEIILVDDGSSLAATRELISQFSRRNQWTVVGHERALGHSASCASGANLATRPYLCLLNSDTVVTPWCWRLFEKAFQEDASIGVAGPSTSLSGTVQTLARAQAERFYWNDSQVQAFARMLLDDCRWSGLVEMDWVSGFALVIRRNLWEKLGGFDTNLADYGNEVELCKRVRDRGYRIVWVRGCYVHHLGRQSYKSEIGDEGIEARIRTAHQYFSHKYSTHK